MLIDWLSLHLDDGAAPEACALLHRMSDKLLRVEAFTGAVVASSAVWVPIRSDSHAVSVRASARGLTLHGSPARCLGDGDAVFGDPRARLDVVAGAAAMVEGARVGLGVPLPDVRANPAAYRVSRVDVTGNLALPTLADVRAALGYLRSSATGRLRVSSTAGDSVYWSQSSTIKSGKAYAKGPHLRYQGARADYVGRRYTSGECDAADRLLRMELSLRRHFWLRAVKPWYEWRCQDWRAVWDAWARPLLGGAAVRDDDSLFRALREVAPTDGQARSALGTWALIQALGYEGAEARVSRSTWYRHIRLLSAAGLGRASLGTGTVVPLRGLRTLSPTLAESWRDVAAA